MKVAKLEGSIGQVFNVGTGYGVTIGELTEMIIRMFDGVEQVVTEQERFRPTNSEVTTLICDSTKAKTYLGWELQLPLNRGCITLLSTFVTS